MTDTDMRTANSDPASRPNWWVKGLATLTLAGLLAACGGGGDSSVGTTTTTTLIGGYGVGGGVMSGSGSSSSSNNADSDDGSMSGDDSGGAGSVEEGFCATGTYELDATYLWEQVMAASPEGGDAEVVSGSVTLELRDDSSAVLSMNDWTFRLFYPGESDTVLATQTGSMDGSWSVDGDGNHSITFSSDDISGSFFLETAQGSFPVPSGVDNLTVPVDFEMFARCGVDLVVLPVEDQQLATVIEWVFDRV